MKKIIVYIALAAVTYLIFDNQRKNSEKRPQSNQGSINSLPYEWSKRPKLNADKDFVHIRFLGDEFLKTLKSYISEFHQELSAGLVSPLNIKIHAQKFEGPFVWGELFSDSNQDKTPLYVIFSSPRAFNPMRISKADLKEYPSKTYKELVKLPPKNWPFWSDKNLPKSLRLKLFEASYKIYEKELQQLFKTLINDKKKIILVTTPINTTAAPHENCSALSNEDQDLLDKIETDFKEGRTKSAFSELEKNIKIFHAHPRANYILGKLYLQRKTLNKAREHLSLAHAYDCSLEKHDPVYNKIMRDLALKFGLELIDFDAIVNSQMGHSAVFLNENMPQNLYYQQFLTLLKSAIKRELNIK